MQTVHYISTPVYNVKIKTEHIETHTSWVDINLTIYFIILNLNEDSDSILLHIPLPLVSS